MAILLNAGMNQKQALFYNLLSTVTCFVGFIIGVVLGSVESLLRYIFGFSGGMFLYIALSCMVRSSFILTFYYMCFFLEIALKVAFK